MFWSSSWLCVPTRPVAAQRFRLKNGLRTREGGSLTLNNVNVDSGQNVPSIFPYIIVSCSQNLEYLEMRKKTFQGENGHLVRRVLRGPSTETSLSSQGDGARRWEGGRGGCGAELRPRSLSPCFLYRSPIVCFELRSTACLAGLSSCSIFNLANFA